MDYKRNQKTGVSLMIILALVLVGIGGAVLTTLTIAHATEIGPNQVQGKVLSIQTHAGWGAGRGTIEVKSDQTGRIYTFYVGSRTNYYPHRYPYIGERVRVHYLNDRGYLKATRVEIR
ncbi:MAG: hypothetical protein MUP30_14080 [Deltaproteobacteria bacterium]|nr:hypothetical protein [Deltaproteobacteria bacterium]